LFLYGIRQSFNEKPRTGRNAPHGVRFEAFTPSFAKRGYGHANSTIIHSDRLNSNQVDVTRLRNPLCGGLKLEFPEGRAPAPNLTRVVAGSV
jgi:hypothetical protein